jgi:hypothetical protein
MGMVVRVATRMILLVVSVLMIVRMDFVFVMTIATTAMCPVGRALREKLLPAMVAAKVKGLSVTLGR